jgi:hypothetical protein
MRRVTATGGEVGGGVGDEICGGGWWVKCQRAKKYSDREKIETSKILLKSRDKGGLFRAHMRRE